MEHQRIIYLHKQYLQQKLSRHELAEWESILANPSYEPLLKQLMSTTWYQLKATPLHDMPTPRAQGLFLEITASPQVKPSKWSRLLHSPLCRVAVAALVVLAMLMAVHTYQQLKTSKPKATTAYQNDVPPGKNGATLTLANGRKILLNNTGVGNIATQTGVKISKTAQGELLYEIMPGSGQKFAYNTLTTTRGEQTKLRLPDGTLVFLNSVSSLKYPTVFNHERKVELTGEAYFEVAHHKAKPFKVISNGQEVEVLGTHFNINSYGDEKAVRTTLLQGSVEVSRAEKTGTAQRRTKVRLRPNQQAVFTTSGDFTVVQVNAEDVMAWTNDQFIFENQSIHDIMRTLSRWYDVEVVYQPNVKDKRFAGTLSRKDHISKLLDKIAFTQAAHFKIEGRRVTVMP